MILHLKIPLTPSETDVIEHIVCAANEMNVEVFMVGAMARIILLEKVYGLPVSRASRDVDFAVVVENWKSFEVVKNKLCEKHGFIAIDGNMHRLRKKTPSPEDFYSIDLIPIGGVQDEFDRLAWPPDMQVIMNVAGFLDALQSTVSIELKVGVVVKVASLPAIALLKIMAWKDRGKSTRGKDAIDLITICKQYQWAGNFERLFDEFSDQLEIYKDHDLVSAWMLGHDTALISSPKNARDVIDLLSDSDSTLLMAQHMSESQAGKINPIDFCLDSIEVFQNGFESAANRADS